MKSNRNRRVRKDGSVYVSPEHHTFVYRGEDGKERWKRVRRELESAPRAKSPLRLYGGRLLGRRVGGDGGHAQRPQYAGTDRAGLRRRPPRTTSREGRPRCGRRSASQTRPRRRRARPLCAVRLVRQLLQGGHTGRDTPANTPTPSASRLGSRPPLQAGRHALAPRQRRPRLRHPRLLPLAPQGRLTFNTFQSHPPYNRQGRADGARPFPCLTVVAIRAVLPEGHSMRMLQDLHPRRLPCCAFAIAYDVFERDTFDGMVRIASQYADQSGVVRT
jgi:hypothetical protein